MSYYLLQTLLGNAYKEDMSIEDIEAALEATKAGAATNSNTEYNLLKQSFDKASSELAEYKRLLAEKETEAETRAREEAERIAKLQADYDELKTAKTLSEHKAQLLGLGYTDELATETAQAMVDGDNAKVFANQQKVFELKEKAIKAELLKNAPRPEIEGNGGKAEDFSKMSVSEKMKLKAEDPLRYSELSGIQQEV